MLIGDGALTRWAANEILDNRTPPLRRLQLARAGDPDKYDLIDWGWRAASPAGQS